MWFVTGEVIFFLKFSSCGDAALRNKAAGSTRGLECVMLAFATYPWREMVLIFNSDQKFPVFPSSLLLGNF